MRYAYTLTIIVIGLFAKLAVMAQSTNTDIVSKIDSAQLNDLCEAQLSYGDADIDSSIYYANKAFEVAKKLHQPFYQASILSDLGFTYVNNGFYSKGFEALTHALALLGDKTISNPILPTPFINYYFPNKNAATNKLLLNGYINNGLALLYGSTRNYPKQIEVLKASEAMIEKIPTERKLLFSITENIVAAYLNINQLDSALGYAQKVEMVEKEMPLNSYSGGIQKLKGDIYFKKELYDSAKAFYVEALRIRSEKKITDPDILSANIHAALSNVYQQKNIFDSGLMHAKLAMQIFRPLKGFLPETIDAYTTLSLGFSHVHQYDSAFFYINLARQLKDSINDNEITNISKYQNENFEEKIRLKAQESQRIVEDNNKRIYVLVAGLLGLGMVMFILIKNNREKQQTNKALEKTLFDLKAAQKQLIQSEKMASLGELTTGIAHEIQNPLNFVNNFSEVSRELMDEMEMELDNGDIGEAKAISLDIKQNLEKINHHGKRADAIVKGMLQHGRKSTGVKQATGINALADEYLRISYHGVRAKDKLFNAEIKTDFDDSIGKINIIPQDIGRVLLNLFNNAFYAVGERQKAQGEGYKAAVWIATKKVNNNIEIRVADNGNGIPPAIIDKIFQPFFTTKPTGEGTGLGLSLSYDIVNVHGGEIRVETKPGDGAEFIVSIPII